MISRDLYYLNNTFNILKKYETIKGQNKIPRISPQQFKKESWSTPGVKGLQIYIPAPLEKFLIMYRMLVYSGFITAWSCL
ncbi:hypothetical protein C922_05166 [Plasmodium inui San Antonio 1]|uniref:Uncharacterized protein n=1 Tax=Plasmodium inui San Antonio 1 TaxID=1237626 RepID=W6ZU45_9APIC|nr:hypothetical protein C922_05166 [Plasmodium inui San Antonio 1]EUD64452.1 hypothetical protein C922_05166 [Plasmodium inui San Antonio 1]